MDFNLAPDGSIVTIGFSYDILIALFIIAIPVCLIWWRILKKRAIPEKPKKWHIAIATILSTVIIYIIMIVVIYFIIKSLYLQ
jgi:uncharacterized membrane protein YbhN (UPF0104 family)